MKENWTQQKYANNIHFSRIIAEQAELKQPREADRADTSKGYENAACTDEEAERQNAAGQADLKAAYEAERGRFQH